jgi:hypothetical protein
MTYLKIILRASRPETNLDRSYEIHLCKGLFNSWSVITAYGRYGIGNSARQKVESFFTIEEAHAYVDRIIKKRLNAKRRIGCNYAITKHISSGEFN